ncbi:MAG: TerC family protein [Pedosphaera sp.]|nr:TerC family protein [Pedosphaera sp.]
MTAPIEIAPVYWVVFLACILVFLALDLGVFHRRTHEVKFREALAWTTLWVILAFLFGTLIAPTFLPNWRAQESAEFITGYIIELSLSMDNVFVIALIFNYFGVPLRFQHRVLFWGILGALVMRGAIIWSGSELIQYFPWMLHLFGALILITGIKMAFASDDKVDPEKNLLIRFTRKFFPVSADFHDSRFTISQNGRRILTPLALVLITVETTDVVFALDSIPAIFAVTQKPFIVFTSNVFAILGLRSLYFVLAGAIGFFRHLKVGLSVVLCFIGLKMLTSSWIHVSTMVSLGIVSGIILISVVTSIITDRRYNARNQST